MKKFTTIAAVAAMMATSAFAGDKLAPAEDEEVFVPVAPASSSGSLGGGAGAVIAGVAAAALIAAAASGDSDSAVTHAADAQ